MATQYAGRWGERVSRVKQNGHMHSNTHAAEHTYRLRPHEGTHMINEYADRWGERVTRDVRFDDGLRAQTLKAMPRQRTTHMTLHESTRMSVLP